MIGVITYVNGEAEYDEEQCCYVPVTVDGINRDKIEGFERDAIDLIIDSFDNLLEKANRIRIQSEGLESAIANGVYCNECYEECICIDESIAKFGKCLNCGAMNYITKCDRCENYFEDGGEFDDIKLCDNCRDYLEEQ